MRVPMVYLQRTAEKFCAPNQLQQVASEPDTIRVSALADTVDSSKARRNVCLPSF